MGGGAGSTRSRMRIVPCEVWESQAGRASVLVFGLGSLGFQAEGRNAWLRLAAIRPVRLMGRC